MLTKILNFHRNTKPRTYFFNPNGMPKSPSDTEKKRAELLKRENDQKANSKIPLDSAMVLAGPEAIATVPTSGDDKGKDNANDKETTEKSDALAVIEDKESKKDDEPKIDQEPKVESPSALTSEVTPPTPENKITSDADETIQQLKQQNEALGAQLNESAETNEKLQSTVEKLMGQMEAMQNMVKQLTDKPPEIAKAQEANDNLDKKKGRSMWDKLKSLTPKQIAGGVIAAVAVGVIAVYGAPLALSIVSTTEIAKVVGLGTWGLAGLATGNAAVATLPFVGAVSVAQAIATGAVAGGAALGFLGKSLMKGNPENKTPAQNQNPEAPQNLAGNTGVESKEQLKKTENLKEMPDGTKIKAQIRIVDPETKGYKLQDVSMEVKTDQANEKYVDLSPSGSNDKISGYLYAKTGKGETKADYSKGVIQDNTDHVFVDGKNNPTQFHIVSFEKVAPGEAVADQPVDTNKPDEVIPAESLADTVEVEAAQIDDEQEEIKPNHDVSTLAVAEKAPEDQTKSPGNLTGEDGEENGEDKEKTKDVPQSVESNEKSDKVVFTNEKGAKLVTNIKDFPTRQEAVKTLHKISEHMGDLSIVDGNIPYVKKVVDGKTLYDLDFSYSKVKFSEYKEGDESSDTSSENQTDKQEATSEVKPETKDSSPDSKAEDANTIKLEGKEGSDFITIKGKNGEIVQVPRVYDSPEQLKKAMDKLKEVSDIDGTGKLVKLSGGDIKLHPGIRNQLEYIQIDTSAPKEPIVPPTNEEPKDIPETKEESTTESSEAGLDNGESTDNKPRQPDSTFENNGTVAVNKIFDKIKSTVDIDTKRDEYTVLKQKYQNQLEAINHQKEGDASISLDRFQKTKAISGIYDELPESIKILAKSMEASEEYSKQKLDARASDPTNGVKGVAAEGASKFNRNLSVLLALEKLENTSNEAIKTGEHWFGIQGVAAGKTKEGQIANAMGQTAFEKLKPNTEVWNYVFDQAKIVLENWQKDGNDRNIDLDKLKNGDVSVLKGLPDLVQQEFGKIMSEVLTGKSIHSQIQNPEN